MTQPHTEADLLRNIEVYRQEADRSRKWAAIRRQEAASEEARAVLLDGRAAEIEAMLPGLPQRTERTERRHARAARSPA